MNDDLPKEPDRHLRVEVLAQRFAEDYTHYQYAFVEFLVAHLTDISKAFNGDLQQALILAVIGQVRLRARRQAEMTGKALPPPETLSITASRLADVTGIPRETVRRKLKLLEARGWIARRPDGAFYIVADTMGRTCPPVSTLPNRTSAAGGRWPDLSSSWAAFCIRPRVEAHCPTKHCSFRAGTVFFPCSKPVIFAP